MLFTSCFLSRRPHHLYFYKSQHHVQVFRLLSNFFLSMYPIFYCPVLPPWQAGVEEGGTGRELYSSASMSRCVMEMSLSIGQIQLFILSRIFKCVWFFAQLVYTFFVDIHSLGRHMGGYSGNMGYLACCQSAMKKIFAS